MSIFLIYNEKLKLQCNIIQFLVLVSCWKNNKKITHIFRCLRISVPPFSHYYFVIYISNLYIVLVVLTYLLYGYLLYVHLCWIIFSGLLFSLSRPRADKYNINISRKRWKCNLLWLNMIISKSNGFSSISSIRKKVQCLFGNLSEYFGNLHFLNWEIYYVEFRHIFKMLYTKLFDFFFSFCLYELTFG